MKVLGGSDNFPLAGLWLHLPPPFRAEYLRLMALANPPRSLFIFSDELSFPWEIVRPSGQIHGAYCELPPLGVSHLLGRWRPVPGRSRRRCRSTA